MFLEMKWLILCQVLAYFIPPLFVVSLRFDSYQLGSFNCGKFFQTGIELQYPNAEFDHFQLLSLSAQYHVLL